MVGDVRTDDGLREALTDLARSGGWEGSLGRTILAKVERQVSGRACRTRAIADAPHAMYAQPLVGVAWECLAVPTVSVIGARSPLACVERVIARAMAAEANLTAAVLSRLSCEQKRTP